jgi:hypothetical protein
LSSKPAAPANRDEDPAVPKAANSLANGNYGNYGRVFNDFDGFSGKARFQHWYKSRHAKDLPDLPALPFSCNFRGIRTADQQQECCQATICHHNTIEPFSHQAPRPKSRPVKWCNGGARGDQITSAT